MTVENRTINDMSLTEEYKDHTVKNPVNSLRYEDLPDNAFKVLNQNIRRMTVTIQILDEDTKEVVETIHGRAEDGSVSVNAESLIRRDASLKLAINKDLFPEPDSLIWFGNICRIYIGIDDNTKVEEPVNFLIGTFWIEQAGYSLTARNHTIDLVLRDKMMKWEDSQLEYALRIEIDTPIDVAIKSLMEHIGETDFGHFDEVDENEVVPYTMEFGIGDDILSIITELRDMYMDYVVGYDVSGKFEFRKVNVQRYDDIEDSKWRFDAQDEVLKTMISYSENYNFKQIRNRILVYGGTSEVTGLTPMSEVRNTDAKSPFNVNAIGEKTEVIVEDRYVLNEQCNALAKYEIYKRSNFQEVANISTVPIYVLDVFDIVDVIHPYTRIESEYIVDKISFGFRPDDEMSIVAHKLYYATVEYGEEDIPLVNYIIKGIEEYGWIRLAEDRILQAFNIQGSGRGTINVTFVNNLVGGFQMSMTSYPTTSNQSLEIDLADYAEVNMEGKLGDFVASSQKNNDDAISRVLAHEMVHAVTNDYLGHDKGANLPVFFKEGLSEALHGSHGRFHSVYPSLSKTNKKQEIIKQAEWLLEGNFNGTQEDYVASYMITWAIYRLAKRNGVWSNMFYRLKQESNITFNFILKALPIAPTISEVNSLIINELTGNMDSVWNYLLDNIPSNNTDTGSILGILGENVHGVPITDEMILNVNDFSGEMSIGFDIRFIR